MIHKKILFRSAGNPGGAHKTFFAGNNKLKKVYCVEEEKAEETDIYSAAIPYGSAVSLFLDKGRRRKRPYYA